MEQLRELLLLRSNDLLLDSFLDNIFIVTILTDGGCLDNVRLIVKEELVNAGASQDTLEPRVNVASVPEPHIAGPASLPVTSPAS